jgi:hypothetical protein
VIPLSSRVDIVLESGEDCQVFGVSKCVTRAGKGRREVACELSDMSSLEVSLFKVEHTLRTRELARKRRRVAPKITYSSMICASATRIHLADHGLIRRLRHYRSEDSLCHGTATDVTQANEQD